MRRCGALFGVGGISLLLGIALAGDGDLLWHSEIRGDPDLYLGSWTATATKRLVIVGGSGWSGPRASRFSVWGVGQKDGELAWESHIAPSEESSNYVDALAAQGNVVIAVGSTETIERGQSFTVVAFDARDGAKLWQQDLDGDDDLNDQGSGVAIKGRTAVAVGRIVSTDGGGAFTVRACDVRSGAVLWEDIHDREGAGSDTASAVAILGRRVFAVGSTYAAETGLSATIRAYDLRHGALLWEAHHDLQDGGLDQFAHVVAARGRVYASGISWDGDGRRVTVTRSYRAKDGELLWEDLHALDGARDDRPLSIAVDGSLLVVGGRDTLGGKSAMMVRALDARTGALAWSHRIERPVDATGLDRDATRMVALGKKAVYASGVHGSPNFDAGAVVVALRRKDGSEIWRDTYDTENRETAWSGAKVKSRLFVSGESETPGRDWLIPIRAYNAK